MANKKFPYTVKTPLDIMELSDKEYDDLFKNEEFGIDAGYVLLCHEGCAMYSILKKFSRNPVSFS